jgi:hypothetical protein
MKKKICNLKFEERSIVMYAYITEISKDFKKLLEKSTYKLIQLPHLKKNNITLFIISHHNEIFPFNILKILIDCYGKF